jgi:hypothetical protein
VRRAVDIGQRIDRKHGKFVEWYWRRDPRC